MVKIIFLGPPGSGKGTYSSRIGPKLEIPNISTGDLLRNEASLETELGKKAKDYMNRGELSPDELVIQVLKKRIEKEDCQNGFILDGFPRTINQAKELEKMTNIDIVINLYLPDEILIEKICARRVCKNCGDNYNIADINRDGIFMPPMLPKKEGICDKCGSELIRRKDDNIKTIKNRLEVYYKNTQPLIDYYKDRGILKQVNVKNIPSIMIPQILELINKGP